MKWISDDKLNHLRAIVGNPDFSSTNYTFVKELGRGGMGTVYLAEDRELDRLVAIKVLNTSEVTDDLRDRMIREAQIIARLEHPGIVPVHDVGTLPDGRVFYAMKYVRGSRLDEYAAQNSSLRELGSSKTSIAVPQFQHRTLQESRAHRYLHLKYQQ